MIKNFFVAYKAKGEDGEVLTCNCACVGIALPINTQRLQELKAELEKQLHYTDLVITNIVPYSLLNGE